MISACGSGGGETGRSRNERAIADRIDVISVIAKWLPMHMRGPLLNGKYANWGRFDSSEYNRLLRHAASLTGQARYAAYGALDLKLARDAAPMIAVSISNTPTLVSQRVGCTVLRPQLDLTAMCLR